MSAKAISTAGTTPDEFSPYWPKDVMKMKEMLIDWTPVNSFNTRTASCNIFFHSMLSQSGNESRD